MKTIQQEVHFDAKPEEVYEAYVDAKKHGEFTGSKVVFEKKVGGKFSAWGGGDTFYVYGRIRVAEIIARIF